MSTIKPRRITQLLTKKSVIFSLYGCHTRCRCGIETKHATVSALCQRDSEAFPGRRSLVRVTAATKHENNFCAKHATVCRPLRPTQRTKRVYYLYLHERFQITVSPAAYRH